MGAEGNNCPPPGRTFLLSENFLAVGTFSRKCIRSKGIFTLKFRKPGLD